MTVIADVDHFQFKDESHITSQPHIEVDYGHHSASHEDSEAHDSHHEDSH